MNNWVIILQLFILLPLYSQSGKYPPGRILDSIEIDGQQDESFCLYLPSDHDGLYERPLVLIFDPMARGKTGIAPFVSAAEKYGHILVCSNKVKNGPYEKNFAIADRMFQDVIQRFRIDGERIYLAGFSGGGRLATALAIINGQVQGVISCGAGISVNSGYLPTDQNFSYAAIIGDEDMNFKELQHTRNYLRRISLPSEVFTLSMDHRWPDPNAVELAFDWLELEAYRKGLATTDPNVIDGIYRDHFQLGLKKEADNDLVGALDHFGWILRNMNPYFELDSLRQRTGNIRSSKTYKDQVKQINRALALEKEYREMFIQRFQQDLSRDNPRMAWWENKINRLNEQAESAGAIDQKMYNRLNYQLFAWAIETAQLDQNIDRIEQRMFCYDLCLLTDPNYAFPYLKQIEYAILLKDHERALDYLERLLKHGFEDRSALEGIPSIDRLKNDPRYKELINEMNTKTQ